MQRKVYLTIILSTLLSFTLNLSFHHDLLTSLLNSLIVGFSITFTVKQLPNKVDTIFNSFLIISLGVIPLFYYKPANWIIAFLPLVSLGGFYLTRKDFPKILVIFGVFLFFGNLYSGEIIKYPLNIQSTQLIFNSPEINFHLLRHQQDALFIPYTARLVVYSQLVYIYALLTNLFDFLNLKNLYDILLIANLYPLFSGTFNILKQKDRYRNFCMAAFLVTALTIGIDRSADKFQSLYLIGPIFIYLILRGAQTINKKLYIAFWILGLLIALNNLSFNI